MENSLAAMIKTPTGHVEIINENGKYIAVHYQDEETKREVFKSTKAAAESVAHEYFGA